MMPGYLALPLDKEVDYPTYMQKRQFKPMRPGQTSYWQNYGKFFVSFQKAMYGKAATPENQFAYDYLPKLDTSYDVLKAFDLMHEGKMNGYICQGFNPLMSIPDKNKVRESLSKLKFLITMDPLETETARFWEDHGEFNPIDPAKVMTEVIQLPITLFAEDEGSLGQFQPLAAMARAGAGRPLGDPLGHRRHRRRVRPHAQALPEGGRRVPPTRS